MKEIKVNELTDNLFETIRLFRIALVEQDRQHDAPDDAQAHEQRDGREARGRHLGGRQALHADLLGRGLRDLRLIVQRPDDR